MLPKTHILLGAIFSVIFYLLFPNTEWYNLFLIFFSSFLIDFDHYLASIFKDESNISLSKSLEYHKKQGIIQFNERARGIRRKGSFHLFHTIEFHIFIFALGLIFMPFLYIFIGMAFHSLCDILYLTKADYLYRREFFLFKYIIRRLKEKQ
jgi:hypothetical protein